MAKKELDLGRVMLPRYSGVDTGTTKIVRGQSLDALGVANHQVAPQAVSVGKISSTQGGRQDAHILCSICMATCATFIRVTCGYVHDSHILDEPVLEAGGFYPDQTLRELVDLLLLTGPTGDHE